MSDKQKPKQRLAHVLWIGGSTCAGKTTMTKLLGTRYGVRTYHVDKALREHMGQIDPVTYPALHEWSTMPWTERCVRPWKVQLADSIAAYEEQFRMVVEDLLSAAPTPVLVEGAALLPHLVAPWLKHKRQAIWAVPSQAFLQQHHSKRISVVLRIRGPTEDPDRAFRNWMDFGDEFARWIVESTEKLGLPLVVVDGGRTLGENAQVVARHFGLGSP